MSACTIEVIKLVGNYYNITVGNVCYNTDKVLTAIIDKKNLEGFASIILQIVSKSGSNKSRDETLLNYQWLEYVAMYANQAANNTAFAKTFLHDINMALEKSSYLTGQYLSVADIVAYYVLYPLLERLSVAEREYIMHVCRWSKHIQAQPRVCKNKPPLALNTLHLSVLAPAVH